MKILAVSIVCPYPLDGGGSIAYFKSLDQIRGKHELTLICPEPSESDRLKLLEVWPDVEFSFFHIGDVGYKPTILRTIVNLFKSKKTASKKAEFRSQMQLDRLDFVNYYFNDLVEIVQKKCLEKSFDLIQVDFIDLVSLVYFLPKNVKTIFVQHEIKHRRLLAEYQSLALENVSDLWYINNIKALEVAHMNAYDKVIVLSDLDKARLTDDGVRIEKLVTAPASIHISEHDINKPFVFKNKLVFLGPDNHFPNLDGVDWFLEKVWPKLTLSFPELEFHVMGKWNESNKTRYISIPKVHFKGYVENLDDELDGAFMLVPLRIGGGIRMKILEGAAYHCPIVSTVVGAEGLPVVDGIHCLLPSTADEFIEKIKTLINDEELQNKLTINAQSIFESAYSEDQIGEIRNQIIIDCVNS
jgi:glycosyltransferase involved in cell wall biosynthesis